MSNTECFKEYTSVEFSSFLNSNYLPNKSIEVSLNGEPLLCSGALPCFLKDEWEGEELLYILKWRHKEKSQVVLDFFEYKQISCKRIIFSKKPSLISISNGYLYIVGGRQIHLISATSLNPANKYAVEGDAVFDLVPAYLESGEKGASLYGRSQREGYYKREFSPRMASSQSWWAAARLLFKKASKQINGQIKVVIPNVIGLLISANLDSIHLVDLTNMKVFEEKSLKISETFSTSSVMLKVVDCSHDEYDSSIKVGLFEKDGFHIQILVLNVQYDRDKKEKLTAHTDHQKTRQNPDRPPLLSCFTNSEIIDWESIEFLHQISYVAEGKIIDIILTQDYFLYYSSPSPSANIPIASLVDYDSPECHHPILPLEHKIHNMYMQDTLTDWRSPRGFEALFDSALAPNRYSQEFIICTASVSCINEVKAEMLDPLRMLINWHKLYRVRALIEIDGCIVVLRESSLSSILPISKDQFLLEQVAGDGIAKDVENRKENSDKSIFSKNSQDSKDFHSFAPNTIPFQAQTQRDIQESWVHDRETNENQGHRLYISYYQKLITLITLITNQNANLSIGKCPSIITNSLLCNLAKDSISFYSEILTKTSQSALAPQDPLKHAFLLHCLRFFEQLQMRSAKAVNVFGADFITLLLEHDLDLCCSAELKKSKWVSHHHYSWFWKPLFSDLVTRENEINPVLKNIMSDSEFTSHQMTEFFREQAVYLFPYNYSSLLGFCYAPVPESAKLRLIVSFTMSQVTAGKKINQLLRQFLVLSREYPFFQKYEEFWMDLFESISKKSFDPNNSISDCHEPFEVARKEVFGRNGESIWDILAMNESEKVEIKLQNLDASRYNKFMNEIEDGQKEEGQVLSGWVFLFRAATLKLNSLNGKHNGSENGGERKQKLIHTLRLTLKCLEKVKSMCRKLYSPSDVNEKFILDKVCGEMVGLDPVLIYESLSPTEELLKMVMAVLADEETEVSSIASMENISFYLLSRVVESAEGEEVDGTIIQVQRYIKRKELQKMIRSSKYLRIFEDLNLSFEARNILGIE